MIQQASVNGLIRMILIIILVYYGIKIISRLLTPFLIKYVSKKAEQRFGGQFGNFQQQRQQEPSKKEGEVTIDKMPNRKSSNKEVGEYVDYEEID
ncbi:DUF4834 family protein [Aestuariibaculum sp. M13]|uniref:DUF4834 family protein n=1 Tax=Aestuariibaculum sp. M13 TaxID=2967132 RepID=UPI002159F2B5|nr:DUF4834 family protein [Aestuariibaculum sp. M13]MCR8668116.1 DUF4834 family protein [Aestuariibaculum sp. M13]